MYNLIMWLVYFGLVIILIIFFIIAMKFNSLKQVLKNALTIMEGEATLYRRRAIDSAEQIKITLEKDFEFEDWARRFGGYYELIGIMKGLNLAIRILIFWLPKNL